MYFRLVICHLVGFKEKFDIFESVWEGRHSGEILKHVMYIKQILVFGLFPICLIKNA